MIEALLIWYFGMGMMVAGYWLGTELSKTSKVGLLTSVFFILFVVLGWPSAINDFHQSEDDR